MKPLFLGSVVERSGKSMVALGLAKNFEGKVGYFKPFKEMLICTGDKVVDQDAYLMKKVFGLKQSENDLSPFTYDVFSSPSMREIVQAYHKVRNESELMLIEGTRDITTGCLHDVSGIAVAKELGANVILVSSSQAPALDKICLLRRFMSEYGLALKGVILNTSDDPAVPGLLESKGIAVLGSIPTATELKTFRVRDLADYLSAQILAGEVGMDRVVDKILVGAMSAETAIKPMRRVPRKALITGGDRADIQLAALSTDTSCLILTGGLKPARTVLSKAEELKVPVLLVDQSTMVTAEMVDHVIARLDAGDKEKIELIENLVRENVDLSRVFAD